MHAKTNNKKQLISKGFLQSGSDLPITNDISFKHPTIEDIFLLDKEHNGLYAESTYYSMVNIFLTDPYDFMVQLDDEGIDYEKSTDFQVFLILFRNHIKTIKKIADQQGLSSEQLSYLLNNNIYFSSFKFFLGIDSFYIAKDSNGNEALGYGDGKFLMNSEVYSYVTEFVRRINGIQDTDKIIPADDVAKQILIEDERDNLKRKLKKKDNDENVNKDRLGNLLSSVTWACNGGITPFNRHQLHMYDLVDCTSRTDKMLTYKNTMTGLYSGCVEKNKINFNELHWST